MSKTNNNREAIQAEACRFLESCIVVTVATAYKSVPYNSMLYYATDKHCDFYVETIENSGKYLSLIMNPNCAFVVPDGENQVSVQARGWAVVLKGEEKKQARKLLVKKRHEFGVGKWPLHQLRESHDKDINVSKKVIFKIIPHDLIFFNPSNRSYPASLSHTMHTIKI